MDEVEEILNCELDQCFDALFQAEVMSEAELEYLKQGSRGSWSDYQLCFKLIVDRIMEQIKDGRFRRWDFDLWDARWRKNDGLSAGAEIFMPVASKEIAAKRGILSRIVRDFRKRCCDEVERLIADLNMAEDICALNRIKEEAISKGVLNDDGRLLHNHSWLHSKRVFVLYHQKVRDCLPNKK